MAPFGTSREGTVFKSTKIKPWGFKLFPWQQNMGAFQYKVCGDLRRQTVILTLTCWYYIFWSADGWSAVCFRVLIIACWATCYLLVISTISPLSSCCSRPFKQNYFFNKLVFAKLQCSYLGMPSSLNVCWWQQIMPGCSTGSRMKNLTIAIVGVSKCLLDH